MESHQHFILHKPTGYLSQFASNQRKQRKKRLLGELGDFPESIMPVGRLDEGSEGLLLLTTNGKLSEEIRSRKVEKEYVAQLDGLVNREAIKQLENGVKISIAGKKYTTLPCQAEMLVEEPDFPPRGKRIRSDRHGPTSWIRIIITEGKFRQVRKMTAAVGFPTLRLVRVRVGKIRLGEFRPGLVKELGKLEF